MEDYRRCILTKTRKILPFKVEYPAFPFYCRTAPNNTTVERTREETSNMATCIFFVGYCPILNTKLSQLGSISSRFLNVYPCLRCRWHYHTTIFTNMVENSSKSTIFLKTSGDCWKHICTVHAPNEKDVMTSSCLDRKEVPRSICGVHSTGTGQLVGALCSHMRWLFLLFGGPVCDDQISNCPLDRMY